MTTYNCLLFLTLPCPLLENTSQSNSVQVHPHSFPDLACPWFLYEKKKCLVVVDKLKSPSHSQTWPDEQRESVCIDNPTENRPTATEKYLARAFSHAFACEHVPEPSLVPSPHSTAIHVQAWPWHGCVSYVKGGMLLFSVLSVMLEQPMVIWSGYVRYTSAPRPF